MAITGHKTEKAFLRYIKLMPSDHAKLLKDHWERRKLVESVPAKVQNYRGIFLTFMWKFKRANYLTAPRP